MCPLTFKAKEFFRQNSQVCFSTSSRRIILCFSSRLIQSADEDQIWSRETRSSLKMLLKSRQCVLIVKCMFKIRRFVLPSSVWGAEFCGCSRKWNYCCPPKYILLSRKPILCRRFRDYHQVKLLQCIEMIAGKLSREHTWKWSIETQVINPWNDPANMYSNIKALFDMRG